MKTVLEIAQEMAPMCAIETPEFLFPASSDRQNEILLLRCLNESGKELQSRFDWPELKKQYTLTGVGDGAIAMPGDYSRLVRGLAVKTNTGSTVRGSLSDDEFNRLTAVAGIPRFFRASTTSIQLWPYLNIGETASLIYQTVNWLDADRDEIIADDARPLFSDELLRKGAQWRWRRAKGQDFTDWLSEFEADLKNYSSFARSERLP